MSKQYHKLRKKNIRCKAITYKLKECDRYVEAGVDYCSSHDYYNILTDTQKGLIKDAFKKAVDNITNERLNEQVNEQVNEILQQLKIKCCDRCNKFHFGETTRCDVCKGDNTKRWQVKKTNKVRCKGKNRYGNPCENIVTDKCFCNFHQYMAEYTEEQLATIVLCRGCKMHRYMEDGYNSCKKCRERGEINRQYHKKYKILCIHCHKYEADDTGYCGKHLVEKWKNEQEELGFIVCCNYVRGCRNYKYDDNDEDSNYSKCISCLKEVVYSDYKIGARKRNLVFELSKDEIYSMIEKQCYYCKEINKIGWNGIDRLDNKKGYIESNVVPCCTMCNIMKSGFSKNIFLKFCKNIVNNYPCTDQFNNNELINHRTFADYKYSTEHRKKKINFLITDEEFNECLKSKCFYCGNTNIKNQIGLDRVDSNGHYTKYNIVACCKYCNYMKNNNAVDKFIQKCFKIKKYHNNANN